MPKINPNHFYQYLRCPSWIWLDVFGDAEKRRQLHPLSELLWRQGLLHDTHIIPNQEFVKVENDDLDDAATETLRLMRQGRQTIYRGVLIDDEWVARPDVLERVEGKSLFGNYYYVACDIKRVRYLEDVHRFQGVFYALLLEKIQGTRPVQGYVMNPDKEVLNFIIEDSLEKFHLTLGEIEKILRGGKPPPFISSACRESPWLNHCIKEAESCDDLALIAHVSSDERSSFIEAGYASVRELVKVPVDLVVKKVTGVGKRRIEHLYRQAQVLVEGNPILIEPIDLSKAPVELYIDIESDPLRDVVCEGDKATYTPFFADSPEEEKSAWLSFVNFVGKYKGAPIYHYGHFEIFVIQRLAEKYGHALENFETLSDIGRAVFHNAVFPVYFYSLKDIARVLGFNWRHPEASGLNSIFWYHNWIETNNRKTREDIINYNEDDVRATKLLKDWLVKKSGEKKV